MLSIGIIGGGAAGICAALCLGKIAIKNHFELEISIYDKENLYCGRAFRAEHDVTLTNTSIGSTLLGELQFDFIQFVKKRYNRTLESTDFVPRYYFAQYFKFAINNLGKNEFISVRTVNENIQDLDYSTASKIQLTSDLNHTYFHHKIILATGLEFTNISDENVLTPYPLASITNIDSQADIAILGSSLTAIDLLVLLHWNAHQGNITLLSRNANLPSVREEIVYNSQSQLQPILASSQFRQLSLTNQLNMILDYCTEQVLIFNTADSAKTQLEHDLLLCDSGKNQWQYDMIYLIDYFDHIWCYLDHHLKDWVNNILGRLKRFMGAMPKVNGYKILNLFDRQQLKIEKLECNERDEEKCSSLNTSIVQCSKFSRK